MVAPLMESQARQREMSRLRTALRSRERMAASAAGLRRGGERPTTATSIRAQRERQAQEAQLELLERKRVFEATLAEHLQKQDRADRSRPGQLLQVRRHEARLLSESRKHVWEARTARRDADFHRAIMQHRAAVEKWDPLSQLPPTQCLSLIHI